jgi:hypothetical protein
MRSAIQAGLTRADSSQPALNQTLLVPNANSNPAERLDAMVFADRRADARVGRIAALPT